MHGVPPGFSRSQRGRAARAPARDPGVAGCRAGRRAPCRASLHVSRLRRGPRVHQPRRRRGRGRRPSPGAVDRMGAGHRDVVDARDPWVAPQRFRHGRQDRRADQRVTRRNRHASGGLPASTLERLRDRRFRREPRLRVRSDASALAFIHDVGFCSTFYRFPEGVACLWEAVVGRRNPRWPRRSHHDDGVGLTWQLKDTLPSRRDVYYGKLLKGRPLLVALDVFPAFYGVTRGRQRARDYRAEYDAGHLSLTARRLMDALVREHPQYTRGLRANTFMLDPGKTREFERAMAELQQGLWIVKTEERYEPTFSFRWDLLEAWLPDAVAEGRRLARGRAREPPAPGDGVGQPRLQQIPAVRERRLVALLGLHHPEPLLQLGHRALELVRLPGLEHEGVAAQLARVLRVLAGERVHETPGRVREAARLVLGAIVARALAPARERVEGREDVERDQHRPRLEDLAVVDVTRGGQVVLETPGQPHAVVVVRVPRPARARAADDRLPQARHALRKTVEGRAEADVLHEGQRGLRAPHAEPRRAAEAPIASCLEIAGGRRRSARIAGWHSGSAPSFFRRRLAVHRHHARARAPGHPAQR